MAKEIVLKTERLILRKPELADVKDYVEGCNNINISKNIGSMPFPYSVKDARDYLGTKIKEWGKNDYLFVIVLKEEDKVIGAIGLHDINFKEKSSKTGSWISERYQRKGYITEAKIAANTFAFRKLGLEKLISPVFVDNTASNATQKRVGYEFVKAKKKAAKCLATGKVHDENFYELSSTRWNRVLPGLKKYLRNKIKYLKD